MSRADLARARDAAAPAAELHRLAAHDEMLVRRAVAAHPNAPRSALERLAKDPDPQVRVAVAANPSAPAAALRALVATAAPARGFRNIARRKALLAVAEHPNATHELLRRLASDGDRLVARVAAGRG